MAKNKEVYDAGVYAIYRTLKIINQRKESGQHTIFSDSASAVDRARTDSMGPGQRPATATHEVGGHISGRSSATTIRWTPAHQGVEGNEAARTWAGPRQRADPRRTTYRTY